MPELFNEKAHHHDLRNKDQWEIENFRTMKYGRETIRNLGPKMWSLVPNHIKEATSLQQFKKKIRLWKPNDCACRLCKSFVDQLGFLN